MLPFIDAEVGSAGLAEAAASLVPDPAAFVLAKEVVSS